MIKIIERATIETIPIEFDYSQNEEQKQLVGEYEKSEKDIDFNAKRTGKYPVVYIDGVIVESVNIVIFKLNNDSIMPNLELEFVDPSNKLIDENFPLDDSIISVFKKSDTDSYMSIKQDFKIIEFKINKSSGKKNRRSEGGNRTGSLTYKIKAILNVDDLYNMYFESYENTSFNVLKEIATDCNLGFATNINDTNDEMVWINPANYKIDFIKDVINHSYLSDETYLYGYIDFFYNLNYVDIEKQLQSDISNQMNINDSNELSDDVEPAEVPLILTNNPDQSTTNMYISQYTVENRSTAINLDYGYRHRITYYNTTESEIKRYSLDSISEEGNDENIILKGDPDKDGGLYETLINGTWMGKMDSDNIHENYLHSELQNSNNLKFLQKLKIVVKLSNPNYGLYRFQKVLVELYNFTKLDNETNTVNSENLNKNNQWNNNIIHKLSGEWLITAINYSFSKTDGNNQLITLVKRELTSNYTFPRQEKN